MASVIFDFDSTLIAIESLEKILSASLESRPEVVAAIEAITAKGMNGQLSFGESLAQRLALAAPCKADVQQFGQEAYKYLTPGIDAVIRELHEREVDVRIVSGGLMEAILPLARVLGIPEGNVHAVRLVWSETGSFMGIDPGDPFSHSKRLGFEGIVDKLKRPIVVIGDGMTDYQLYESRLADAFIAFTGHVKRGSVINVAQHFAANAKEVQTLLERWI